MDFLRKSADVLAIPFWIVLIVFLALVDTEGTGMFVLWCTSMLFAICGLVIDGGFTLLDAAYP